MNCEASNSKTFHKYSSMMSFVKSRLTDVGCKPSRRHPLLLMGELKGG